MLECFCAAPSSPIIHQEAEGSYKEKQLVVFMYEYIYKRVVSMKAVRRTFDSSFKSTSDASPEKTYKGDLTGYLAVRRTFGPLTSDSERRLERSYRDPENRPVQRRLPFL